MASKNVKKTQNKARSGGSSKSKGSTSAKSRKPANVKSDYESVKPKKEHKALKAAVPYILMLLGVVLAICFFTVHILQSDDGAGVVGYYIQWFWCGLFGISSFLIPFVLIYIGVKWCLYNIKLKDASAENREELENCRKRNILQTVMAALLILFLATLIGIFADSFDDFDFAGMWDEAADDLTGGGVIGGTLAVLMVMAFESVISSIIVIFIIIFIVIFMLGLTPDRIIIYIRDQSKLRKEARLAEADDEEDEEEYIEEDDDEKEKEARKHRNRMMAVRTEERAEKKADKGMTVDEIMDDGEKKTENDVYIGPSEDASLEKTAEKVSGKDKNEVDDMLGDDFGGDPVFDDSEFTEISDVIGNLKAENTVNVEAEASDTPDIDMGLIVNEELLSDIAAVAPNDELDEEPVEIETPYVFPPFDMLEKNKNTQKADFTQELQENAKILMETLKSFKVSVREITYSRGPTITRYELKPEAGTRVRAIANLVDDIALNLATSGVRIEAPIPNKPAVGIEVPNRERATVYLRDLIESPKFSDAKSKLTSSLGMDVGGNPIYFDIAKMPHLLIAGATGMGKSVCINSIIVSILYKAKPDEVKLILVDPKKVEFNIYKDIPHLYAPIVSDPKKAAGALASAVAEMERRFELIEEVGVRDIATYNAVTENDPDKEFMPQMVIIIDELADLMMTAPDEVEASICRLAQKARAAGIHIIIGTQRPSVDVITGLIKANIPSRIACTVASQIDSRTILDMAGAEKLIGRGDMLFAPVGASKPMRVQGAFVSEAEVEKIVTFIKSNNKKAKYNSDFVSRIEEEAAKCGMKKGAAGAGGFESDGASDSEGGDSKFQDAVKLAIEEGKISTSLMQRRLGVGYGRAAKIIDTMEQMGYVSKPDGNKPRRVLITMDEYMRRMVDGEIGEE
ncbi:MAG: DNA translocase FtsK 4TM domain-containing protein [Clostridia bacterium]|nr:DNA translocase FtsK 4TM domain-containing protein [Clostridia bacterium]